MTRDRILIVARIISIIALVSLLTACGGGSSSTDLDDAVLSGDDVFGNAIVDDEKVCLSITECEYTKDASPICIIFDFENKSDESVAIDLDEVIIDGEEISKPSELDDDPIEPGNYSVNRYIDLEVLQNKGVSDFEEIEFVVVVSINDKEYTKRKIKLERESFKDIQESSDDTNKADNAICEIVSNKDFYLSLTDCSYSGEGSDVTLEFAYDNRSGNMAKVYLEEVSADGKSLAITPGSDDEPMEVGNFSVYRYIDQEALQNVGVSDFKEMEFVVIAEYNGEKSNSKRIQLSRQDFHEE